MKHIQLTAIASLSALALFGCQAPSHTQTTQPTHTTTTPTQTQPATNNNAVKSIRTLNAVTCNDQSVNLNLNQGGIVQEGTLQGYKYCEYNIPLQAGQHLNVNFDTSSLGAYVIVYGRDDLSMTELTDNGYTATQNEVLPVRVLLTRNEARKNSQVPFKVQFNLR